MDKLKLLEIQDVQQDCMKDFFKTFDNINNVRAFENFSMVISNHSQNKIFA